MSDNEYCKSLFILLPIAIHTASNGSIPYDLPATSVSRDKHTEIAIKMIIYNIYIYFYKMIIFIHNIFPPVLNMANI